MSPKAKHVLARDHLDLAREETENSHLGVAATLLLHAAEAAIDALAEQNGIETNPTHWRREEIEMIRISTGDTVDGILARVEALVIAAEEAWSGA
jgi:hypothetical protein